MAVTLSLFAGAGAQFFDGSGNPLTGGFIYTYAAGTTTPIATYTSSSGNSQHQNPIELDAAGRVPGGEIWLSIGVGYKFVLKDSSNALIATYDNIPSSAQPPAANDADAIMYEEGYAVNAGSFIVGKTYRILTLGNTNFIAIGAVSNTVGTHFIATGAGSGTGTAELSQTVEAKLRQTISVKDFGATGDGITNDADAVEAAINAALAGGRSVYFPFGTYNIATAKSFVYSGNLYLFGSGATLLLTAGTPTALSFSATAGATTTLSAGVTDEDKYISVTNAANMAEGQLIWLFTATPVDSGYGYKKQSTFLISNIDGTDIYLSDPSNFPFTIAETTVYTYQPASLYMDGINIVQNGADKRFDTTYLQNTRIQNATIQGYAEFLGDVWFISASYNTFGENLKLNEGRYTINASDGSRNLFFNNIFAKNCRHPIDCNTWTFNTRITNLTGINTQSAIESHPCFEVYFENCSDFTEAGGSIGLRCVGGGVKNTYIGGVNPNPSAGVQSPFLLPAYEYLGQKYTRTYENVQSKTAVLTGGFLKTLYVKNCNVPYVNVDGVSSKITNLSIDTTTVTSSANTLRRVTVLSPDGSVFIADPSETFASVDTIATISGITQANPAVVTAIAHGFSNGDLIYINGVVGMTEVNYLTFTVANKTADTFELAGIDSSGYTAYTSGGKATLGRLAKTIDPCVTPGLGWYPYFQATARVRHNGSTLNPLTAITIPVKVRNVYNIQEDPYRQTKISIRTYSTSDGSVENIYQAVMYVGSTTSATLSAAQAVVPAISTITAVISNFRPHYYTQCVNEGIPLSDAPDYGLYYYSFDVVVTCNNVNDRINYVEVNVDEIRAFTS